VAPVKTNKKYGGLARIIGGCVPLPSGLRDFVFVLLKGWHIFMRTNKQERTLGFSRAGWEFKKSDFLKIGNGKMEAIEKMRQRH
jgi:hypothetical protein